ncbi:MAG: SUMF1/EgtB/PvdO family nonheme iron enzyme [Kiritimatiellaeota bacterium]|nr:SUMF1/EgtB/PvdO family nonheme iron enzyme [Kiritimatiellota bacterium]
MKKWLSVGLLTVVSFACGTSRLMAQTVGDIGDAYMVITLGNPSSVEYWSDVPVGWDSPGGWPEEYKTTKLVLRRVARNVTAVPPIPDDFYLGVFEVTVGQFKQVIPAFNPAGKNDTEAATYDNFNGVGNYTGFLSALSDRVDPGDWPTTNQAFALPPAAQWEYACRAGSPASWNYYYGDDPTATDLENYAWYLDCFPGTVSVQDVGGKIPNDWGLFDMLGNVAELVEGGADVYGGAVSDSAAYCKCDTSYPRAPGNAPFCGFRVYLKLPTEYFTLGITDGTLAPSGGSYTNGQIVTLTADAAPANQEFDCWTGDVATVADVSDAVTTLVMPGSNITVTATYRYFPYLTAVNSTNSGYYASGTTVTLDANATNFPWAFACWEGDTATVADVTDEHTTLVMPGSNITVTATYNLYRTLTVEMGNGGGDYLEGSVVNISAIPPGPHHTFQWVVSPAGATVEIADITSWNTTLVMPGADITLTATYPLIYYPLTVTGGTGSGSYTNGHVVTVTANAAPTAMHVFNGWVGDTHILDNAFSPTATATVAVAANLTATYRPVQLTTADRTYLIVDLAGSGGVSYTNGPPVGGWNETHKTDKMVLKKVDPGTFTMGDNVSYLATSHQVTLSQTFYLGVYPVTQAQWLTVRGQWPDSGYFGLNRDKRPVENIPYAALRGSDAGAQWPANGGIDSGSFISSVRGKALGIALDLPTEAQWEYACRAGSTTAYSFGNNTAELGDYAWYATNNTQEVGLKLPNPWGFYDMHGNVGEWCLDWFANYGSAAQTDPKGGATGVDSSRAWRGGSFQGSIDTCTSAYRGRQAPTNGVRNVGFRLAWTAGVEYNLAVTNGVVNTGGAFLQGVQIPITAEDRTPAWKFLRWEVLPAGTSLGSSFNANNVNTIVTMPNRDVAVTAVYQVNDGYTALTVVNGIGSTNCVNGTVIPIEADPPEPWYVFDGWTGDTADVDDVTAPVTFLTAAGGALTLTATYAIMNPLPSDVHLLTTVGNGVTKTIPVQEGTLAAVTAPPAPAGLVFGWWVVDPEGTPLGAGFDENATTSSVEMPTMDVTLTAVYVKDAGPTPGYLNIRLVDSVTLADLPGAQWSTDGKEFFAPTGKYPLKPGSYTLRFRVPDTNWLTPANVKMTIRAAQTTPLEVPFVWVPVVTGVADSADPRDTVTLSPANGQVLPGKTVTLTAKPTSASVFVEWTDGVATASRKEAPLTNTTYTAIFRLKSSYTAPPILSAGTGTPVPTVGVLFSQVVGINERPATFKAKGLPPGLKINAATGEIAGIPTKAGTFPVIVTATNPNKLARQEPLTITIAELSPYAQGAFTGYLTNGAAQVVGTFTMKASAKGALSVKTILRNASVSFSAKGWAETDGTVYTVAFLTKKGEALSLSVDTSTWAVVGTAAGGNIGASALELAGQWDLFKVNKKSVDYPSAMAELAKYQGYYTVALPATACAMLTPGLDNLQEGAGYLALTVSKNGGVKVAGKLSDGTTLSASTTLLVVGGEGVVPMFAPLYSKRGVASGLLTVLPGLTVPDGNKVVPDTSVMWQWVYPGRGAAATLDGFGALLEPFGAFYAKTASIEAYYGGAAFTTAVDTVSMDVPLVFNARGVASLSADPMDNPFDAKLTVKPATGLFNGTFRRNVAGKSTTVKYLGVLTRTPADAYVGSGAYVLPETVKPYSLKPSYPVLIE